MVVQSFDSIDSVVYEGGSISEKEAFTKAVFDNTAIRELNCIEKSTVLCRLRYDYNMNDEEIINDIMPVLKLRQSRKLLDDYCSLRDISEGLKMHIIEREIPIKVSSVLASFSHEKLRLFSEIIIFLNLGANKIKELISLIDEITQRDDTSINELYYQLGIDVIIKDEKITVSQKWEKIVGLLRKKRFPIWSEIEKRLNRNISSLNLPQNMSLYYPPYLEGDKFKIEIEFSKLDELKEGSKKLIDISNKTELSEIIELI